MGIKLKNKNKQPKKLTRVDLKSNNHKEIERLAGKITSMGNIKSKAEKKTNLLLKFLKELLH